MHAATSYFANNSGIA